jgi:hypothetical protein
MAIDRVRQSPTKRLASWLLTIPSVIIGIVLVELACRLVSLPLPPQNDTDWTRRVVFLDGDGGIFRNIGDIFTYRPNNHVRNLTGFLTHDGFKVEYDYRFATNNLGLVEDGDVFPQKPSFLLLGDSFTEGQGAPPWFRLIRPTLEELGYQAVNGGVLGTGFAQWNKLERYLARQQVEVKKLLIIFISDDFDRVVWNFRSNDFRCLTGLPDCDIAESYFYRLPPQEELAGWTEKISAVRPRIRDRHWLVGRAERLLPASYQVYRFFRERLRNPAALGRSRAAEEQSREAIAELVRRYGANVAFLHLPQKVELGLGPNRLGLAAREAIGNVGGRLYDGFQRCGLTSSDYYARDDHPTAAGYAKIAACAAGVTREMAASVPRLTHADAAQLRSTGGRQP